MKIRTIAQSEEIENRISEIVGSLYKSVLSLESIGIIGIKTRGEFIGKRIAESLNKLNSGSVNFGTLDITLYRDDFRNKSDWPSLKQTNINFDINDKDIILVDDVIFTGRTVRAAIDAIMDYGRPSSVRLLVLVDRGHRELPIQPDYLGFKVETDIREDVKVSLIEVDGKDEIMVASNNNGI